MSAPALRLIAVLGFAALVSCSRSEQTRCAEIDVSYFGHLREGTVFERELDPDGGPVSSDIFPLRFVDGGPLTGDGGFLGLPSICLDDALSDEQWTAQAWIAPSDAGTACGAGCAPTTLMPQATVNFTFAATGTTKVPLEIKDP